MFTPSCYGLVRQSVMEVIMSNPMRIRIFLPVTLMVIWIALVCLSMPGFAMAAEPAGQYSAAGISTIDPRSDPR